MSELEEKGKWGWEIQRDLQAEINQLKTQLAVYKEDMQKDAEKIAWLEKRLKATDALSRMRASVITAFNRSQLNTRVKKAISRLAETEKSLRGGHE